MVKRRPGYERSIYLTKIGLSLTAIFLVITDLSTDGERHVQSSAFSALRLLDCICLECSHRPRESSVHINSPASVLRKRLLPLAVLTPTKPPVFISVCVQTHIKNNLFSKLSCPCKDSSLNEQG